MATIHVTIEHFHGHINDVHVYKNEHTAELAEQNWLKNHNIKNQTDREAKAQNGTEFHIYGCTLEP